MDRWVEAGLPRGIGLVAVGVAKTMDCSKEKTQKKIRKGRRTRKRCERRGALVVTRRSKKSKEREQLRAQERRSTGTSSRYAGRTEHRIKNQNAGKKKKAAAWDDTSRPHAHAGSTLDTPGIIWHI